jgi:GNAT superfamily N-acetyltransferase
MEQRWERHGTFVGVYLAWVDGEPAGAATTYYLDDAFALTGSGTLPHLRGRGAYRALLHARWQDSVERGTPALAVQAGAMSRPILQRCGFQSLGDVDVLLDVLAS